jgi:hypothetical protein
MLVSCLAYSSALKMEAIRSSETSADFHRTIRRDIPEDRTLQIRGLTTLHKYFSSEVLKSGIHVNIPTCEG